LQNIIFLNYFNNNNSNSKGNVSGNVNHISENIFNNSAINLTPNDLFTYYENKCNNGCDDTCIFSTNYTNYFYCAAKSKYSDIIDDLMITNYSNIILSHIYILYL